MKTGLTRFSILTICSVAVVGITFMVWKSDSNRKRIRVDNHLMGLRDRIKRDPSDRQALLALIDSLNDPYLFARSSAAGFLGQLGSNAKEAVPALARALKSDDVYLRRAAALALRDIGPDAKEAVPALIEALKLGNCDTAWFSAEALGNIGSDANEAVPALIECLDVHDLDNVSESSPGPQLAFKAADALAKLSPDAKEALPALKTHLHIPSDHYKVHLARAIRLINPEDPDSLETLTHLLQNARIEIRRAALSALNDLGTGARAAAPAIRSYLARQQTEEDKQQAQFALYTIEGSGRGN